MTKLHEDPFQGVGSQVPMQSCQSAGFTTLKASNDELLVCFIHKKEANTWIVNEMRCVTVQTQIPGVGVTKPISSFPLFSEIFSIVKTHVSYWISHIFLTGVAAAQLQWHLSNINVIQII